MMLVKHWLSVRLSVSDEEQARLAQETALSDPRKRSKFSGSNLQGRSRLVDCGEANDRIFATRVDQSAVG